MTRRLRTLGLILLCSAVTLTLCEFCVRYLQDAVPSRAGTPYRVDPHCGYTQRPTPPDRFDELDDRHVNAYGFRDRVRKPARREGTLRLVGLGDSFVHGDVPIAHNFLRLLEARLGEDREVVIAGQPGWDVRNATGWIRGYGPELRPDLALLCFSVGSDVTGIPIPGAVFQGNLHFTGSRRPLLDLLRKSRLFVLAEQIYLSRVTNAARGLRARLRIGDEDEDDRPPRLPPDDPIVPRGAPYFPGVWGEPDAPDNRTPANAEFLSLQVRNLPLYRTTPDAEVEGWWAQAEAQLRDFDAACREIGADWLLIVAPAEIQVDPTVQAEVLAHAPLPTEAYDFEAPSRRLAEFAEGNGWAWLDPLGALQAAQDSSGIRQYIPNNGHWNVPGNAVMAGQVETAVVSPGQ